MNISMIPTSVYNACQTASGQLAPLTLGQCLTLILNRLEVLKTQKAWTLAGFKALRDERQDLQRIADNLNAHGITPEAL